MKVNITKGDKMAATYMTDQELEQFQISTIKEITRAMFRAFDRGAANHAFWLCEKLTDAEAVLVKKFGWDWDDVENLEISFY